MKNGQIISAEEARNLIATYGVSFVTDFDREIDDFRVEDIEDADKFTLMANYPNGALLYLRDGSVGIYLDESGDFTDNEWGLKA